MMNSLQKEFLSLFNELDQLCKLMYPKNSSHGFDSMRSFAYSLDNSNKSTLLNIIKIRNISLHDANNIVEVSSSSVQFLQGILYGARRRYYNKSRIKIDARLENLRTSNLHTLSKKINIIQSKFMNAETGKKQKVIDGLQRCIDQERSASHLEDLKKYFFDGIRIFNEFVFLENLRRKNLSFMRSKIAELYSDDNEAEYLSNEDLVKIMKGLNNHLNRERAANSIDELHKAYYDFVSVLKSIPFCPSVGQNMKREYENELNQSRHQAIDDIREAFDEAIDDIPTYRLFLKKKLSDYKNKAIARIKRASDEWEIESIVEDFESDIEDLDLD